MISMVCVDINPSFSEEIKRKQFHDAILAKNGLSPETFLIGVTLNLCTIQKETLAALI